MEIYEILKKEHKEVKALFDQLKETGERAVKKRETLFGKLKSELTAHSEVEDEVLYDRLVNGEETRDIILEAKEEHRLVAQLLQELSAADKSTDEWSAKLEVLSEMVEHHVKEEETEMFKTAKSELSKEQAKEIGEEYLVKKEEFMAIPAAEVIAEKVKAGKTQNLRS